MLLVPSERQCKTKKYITYFVEAGPTQQERKELLLNQFNIERLMNTVCQLYCLVVGVSPQHTVVAPSELIRSAK